MPRVSAIITVFNRTTFLGEAIESILSQRCDVEIVVVDDGSTSPVQVRFGNKYPMVRWFRQSNLGLCAARQVGTDAARGEFLCYLDDDDLWNPEKITLQLRFMENVAEAGVVCSEALSFGPTEGDGHPFFADFDEFTRASHQKVVDQPPVYVFERAGLIKPFLRVRPFLVQTMMIRRGFLMKIGGWDRTIKSSGDALDFLLRAAWHGKIGFIDKPLVKIRRGHPDSRSAESNSCFEECRTLRRVSVNYPDGLKKEMKPAMREYFRGVAERCEAEGEHGFAANAWKLAMGQGLPAPGLMLKWLRAKMKG